MAILRKDSVDSIVGDFQKVKTRLEKVQEAKKVEAANIGDQITNLKAQLENQIAQLENRKKSAVAEHERAARVAEKVDNLIS